MTLKKDLLCSLALAGLACIQPLAAAPGPVCGTKIGSFLIEHPISLSQLLSTQTPSIPAAVTTAVSSGTMEVHSRVTYNTGTGILSNDLFLVPAGSPVPTSATFNFVANRFAYLEAAIDDIHTACQPAPALMLTGRIVDATNIYGTPTGAPFSYSFAYNIPAPTAFPIFQPTSVSNIASNSVGLDLGYQGSITATVNFLDQPAGATAPVIVLSIPPFAAQPLSVADNPYQVDATSSFDPAGEPLTFQWSSDKTVSFFPSNTSPVAILTFQGGHGTYNITVIATTEYGITKTQKFAIVH
jgi:hypothetical protein